MKSADQHWFIASGTTSGEGHLVGKRLFAFSSFVQFQAAIHPMYAFVVPTPALPSQSLEPFWKSFLRSLMGQLQEQLNERRRGLAGSDSDKPTVSSSPQRKRVVR